MEPVANDRAADIEPVLLDIERRSAEVLADESFNLVFATRRVLESVAAAPDLDSFIDDARRLDEVQPVMPRIVQNGDGWRIEV